jgi:hypothetical protein
MLRTGFVRAAAGDVVTPCAIFSHAVSKLVTSLCDRIKSQLGIETICHIFGHLKSFRRAGF